jgi:hypothetical protein
MLNLIQNFPSKASEAEQLAEARVAYNKGNSLNRFRMPVLQTLAAEVLSTSEAFSEMGKTVLVERLNSTVSLNFV